MSRVCAVSEDALDPPSTAGLVDVLQSGGLGAVDPLNSLNDDALESFPVICGAARVPCGHAVCES